MSEIISFLREMPYFVSLKGANDEEIKIAEQRLDLCFSYEYCTYLKEFGIASAGNHELTGICNSPRLNVVDVTISERDNNPEVPKDWYVLEQANIDGIVIWQNQKGEVYQTQPFMENKMIANSIVDYIKMK